MIKKLRNKMLLMNIISTFCLIIIAFSAIYVIIHGNVEAKIEQSLYRTFSFHRPNRWHPQPNSVNGQPQQRPDSMKQPSKRELRDLGNFSVFVDSTGTVHTDSMLGENSEHYETVAKTALAQNSDEGEFSSEGIVWRFLRHELKDGNQIIALVDISAEKGLLRQLVLSFAGGALVLLILIFLISLYFANKAIKPVTQAWNKQKQFVADASHELKTPLAAINTNIDVLLSNGDKTITSQEKWLQYMKKEVRRLSELTGNLLFMAKMDGDVPIEKMKGSLSELVESSVLNLEAVAFEKGVKLDYDIEKDIFINMNSAQITRLTLILLDNAIKYSPRNETVTVFLKKISKDQAALSVHNVGEPIPAEDIERIFDRFYRVDKSRSTSGYGLGLAMAKEIAGIHKGKISVESSAENGTEFTVVLTL